MAFALDTSSYTTSAAVFDGAEGRNSSLLLSVDKGEIGLRQSEALFRHIRQLPGVIGKLDINISDIKTVGVSSKPRELEASYMPCFLAGVSQAKTLAKLLKVPYSEFSHQQGHIAAACWSSGHIELLDRPFLALHLSGGTTELLYVRPSGRTIACEIIGGTTDISAGQLVDRAGKFLGLAFPAGKELDALAAKADRKDYFNIRVSGTEFSLSGMENKIKTLGGSPENIAYYTLASIAGAVQRITQKAREIYGTLPVIYSGGVASSVILRNLLEGYFAAPEYSTDNAMGTAILTYRKSIL
jgi:N6-L-threonylcarbamoyladenine synthase